MKKVAARLLTLVALSLLVFSLLGSVQPLSAQNKSLSAQAPQKSTAPSSQTVAPTTDEIPPVARQLLEVTRKWLNGEMSTPGVSAEIREVSRLNSDGRLEVKYNVFVTGAPKDQNYTMVSWPINGRGPSALMEGLSLLKDGLISCAGRTPEQCGDTHKIDDPVELTFNPATGEVFRTALISQDQKTKLFFAIVPDPVAKSDNGCVLEAIRLLPKHELVLVRGKGFQPNEGLEFKGKSYDEEHDWHPKADGHGEYVTGLLPFVKDKKNGTMEVRLKGSKCAPALTFEWGD
jgi:hypothetical protein